MTSVKEWVEEKIKNGYIRYFELDKFSQISIIGRGSFGIVNKADLANTGLVALKIICNENSEEEHDEFNDEFVKELKLLYEVGNHPNINRCLGITKDPKYNILVLEYANEGNLKDGNRENPIEGTPLKYQRLYQICWDDDPKLRPDIEEVYEILIHLKIEDAQSPQHNIHNHIDVKSNSKNNDNDDLSIPSNYPNPIDAVNAPVPKFISLINEIGNIFNEIIELVEGAARHNKQICDILKKQVHAAKSAIQSLKEYREDREDFFSIKNYLHLQDLFDIITRIKKFILEISQMKPLIKYIKTISIAKTFIELCEKFGSCINELFPLTIQI
ncbi:unnamed protein product [Rhizophagus irregularis]|nr:unnamed protein product [Rhizophagus irregularis]